MGIVVAVSIGERKGERKRPVQEARAIASLGIERDVHAEGTERQVSLLMEESIERMKEQGVSVGSGDFAENIVTRGVDLKRLSVGDTIRIGNDCVLRVTRIGKECLSHCRISRSVGYCIMPEEGVFCTVQRSGTLKGGDTVSLILRK